MTGPTNAASDRSDLGPHLFIGMIVLCVAFIGSLWLMRHSFEQHWQNHSRTLTVNRVHELGDLRVVTFTNTDSVLIFPHAPGGWAVTGLSMREVQYGYWNGQSMISYRYLIRRPGKPDDWYTSSGDLLISRRQLRELNLTVNGTSLVALR